MCIGLQVTIFLIILGMGYFMGGGVHFGRLFVGYCLYFGRVFGKFGRVFLDAKCFCNNAYLFYPLVLACIAYWVRNIR